MDTLPEPFAFYQAWTRRLMNDKSKPDTLDAIAREMREHPTMMPSPSTVRAWADRLTALSNQGEGAWIAFADRWPGESAALDDPSVKTRDTVLVTNGINARDRMGRQTNVWLAAPIQSVNEVVAFTDSNHKIHGLTHWKPAFGPAEADRRDAERYRWLRDNAGAGFYMTLESRRESSEWDSEIDAAIAATQEQT